MILTTRQIIILTYLTKYNIKIIKDYAKHNDDFEGVLTALYVNLKLSDKLFNEAYVQAEDALQKLNYYGIKTVNYFERSYPKELSKLSDAPPILYYKGNIKTEKLAAVVGSRETSDYANGLTYQIVDWLKELNYGVVSGLALGIDSFAHERAVQNNQYTIAVLPNSLDSIYPPKNFGLANKILDSGGCLVSELIFGINRGSKSFVQRNRLQSAFSDVVIPIEMGVNSGTMHTIDFAKRYKKRIALLKPNEITDKLDNYAGIRHLIKNSHSSQKLYSDFEGFKSIFLNGDSQLDMSLKMDD